MTLLVYNCEKDETVVVSLQEDVRAVTALLGFPGIRVTS